MIPFLIGLAIGAGAVYLYQRRRIEELRQELRNVEDVRDVYFRQIMRLGGLR